MTLPPPRPKYDARAIANHFLDLAAQEGRALDHLKLQKLVYFSHGWHLAVTARPLVWQNILAWPYGPVVRQVYDEFKTYGRDSIDGRAAYMDEQGDWRQYSATFRPDTEGVVQRVWDVYKGYTGLEMSAMAHDEGTPWHQMVGHLKPEQIRDIVIPNPLIRQHYVDLATKRQGVNR